MDTQHPSNVRRRHPSSWFWIDKTILDHYGPGIGAYGIAVYAILARYADQDGKAFPSLNRIAEMTGISRSSVFRALQKLIEWGLVSKEIHQDEVRGQMSNTYVLETPPHVRETLPPMSERHAPHVRETPEQDLLEQDLKEKRYRGATSAAPPNSRSKRKSMVPWKNSQRKTRFPEDVEEQATWQTGILTDDLMIWLQTHHHANQAEVAYQWQQFTSKALTNGYKYHDWTRAFQNWFASPHYTPMPQQTQEALRVKSNSNSEYAKHLDANGLLSHPDHPGHEFAARPGTRQVYCYTCNVDLGFALPAKE